MQQKQPNNKTCICLTGDIDYFKIETIDGCLAPLFKILKKYDVKMTFPITAKAVEDYPERAEFVINQGYEVAIHGDEHESFYGTVEEQAERLEKAKKIFRNVLGFIPTGFRAPRLRHNENTYLALIETGFLYDSSQARKEVLLKIPMVNKFSYEMSIFPLAKPVLAFAASVRSRQVPANPFFLHSKLVELPLTGPGDWQLILSNRGPMFPPSRSGRIADIWLDILRDIQHKEGQMFVVQSHPYIVSPGYLEAIDVFLESVINDEMVEFKTLGEVTTQFLSRQELPVGHQISLEEV